MKKNNLLIYIDGAPSWVEVWVFDLEVEKSTWWREILLETINISNNFIEKEVDKSLWWKRVKVVVHSAGFVRYEYECIIEKQIWLFHAIKLEIDRVYNGGKNEYSWNWESSKEFRSAERRVQKRYRAFKKYNQREIIITNIINYWVLFLTSIIWFFIGALYGFIIGIIIGVLGIQLASRYTSKAIWWS